MRRIHAPFRYYLDSALKVFIAILLIGFLTQALAFSKKRPVDPLPSPTPVATVSPTPSPSASPAPVSGDLVSYDPASGIEKSFAQPGIDLMNQCYRSGKLKELWMKHKFVSFNSVFEKSPKTNAEAWEEFTRGAPFALNLRWYFTRPKIVGYTYNFYDDSAASWKSGKSETRIFSNKNTVGYYNAKDRAAHWTHELSHQARAGGFVHYTIFQGSAPYEAGDIMEECVYSL